MTPPARSTEASGIATRLYRLPVTPLHWAIVVLCALGLLFDVVEAALSNALAAVFSAPPSVVMPYQLSLVLASVFAGGAVGAPILGWLADRYGRRAALGTALLVLAVTSSIAAASSGAWAVNRVASALVPLALVPLLKSSGVMAMFAVVTAALACSVKLVPTFGPRGLARKPVE
jgi:MFS family permease